MPRMPLMRTKRRKIAHGIFRACGEQLRQAGMVCRAIDIAITDEALVEKTQMQVHGAKSTLARATTRIARTLAPRDKACCRDRR
ncbi:hypothetical protein [Candidatus Burkholderia verschuerenii]|uniref:hypothetical protein n=1 Tax=Candidatus Burkholderia verschuerenii TaxID=242163 RepID=UPI001E3C1628|nr:hypothetical protein [Candidatus Burkholderia verschuerenii]